MNFDDVLARADDEILQTLLGKAGMQLITILDPRLASPTKLKDIVIGLHSRAGLLRSREARNLIFDILRPNEARSLAKLLKVDETDAYSSLKSLRLPKGSARETELFLFFELQPPPEPVSHERVSETSVAVAYSLFQHQRRAAREVQEKIQGHVRRVVLHMPTGAGKTRTAMNIVVEHLRAQEPTLIVWLAHTEELCEQASDEFERAWNVLGNREIPLYRFWGSSEFDPEAARDGMVIAGLAKLYSATKQNIQVASVLGSRSSLVVIDEAHIAVADTYKLMIEALVVHHPSTALIGLTATPGRTWADIEADRKLANFFARQKVELKIDGYTNPVDYLVDQGYLARAIFKPLMHGGGLELTVEDYRRIEAEFDIPASVMLKLAADEQRNLVIIREIEELSKQHERIIVFATTVEHADLIATILRARGYNAASVTGQTPESERARRIDEYKSADTETQILCNFGVLTTGFDAPRTSAAVIARPTKSLVLYSQMVGRAIRGVRAGGNETAVIVTVVDQGLPGFNNVADAFTNWEDIWD